MKKNIKTIIIVTISFISGLSNIAIAQVPILIKNLWAGNSNGFSTELTESNNMLFFQGQNKVYNSELYKTDGTTDGTVLVKAINPAGYSYPLSLTDVNGVLFFLANDGTNGRELWKSDGTAAGTVLVKNINPTGHAFKNGVTSFLNVNGTLFFVADNGTNGQELWKSDGTPAGTVLVKDINPSSTGNPPQQLIDVNGVLFFTADNGVNGQELWKSDGTLAGTVMVKDISLTGSGIPYNTYSYNRCFFAVLNNTLYFQANNVSQGLELWKSDGTNSGTVMVKDIFPGKSSSFSGAKLFAFNNFIYFDATDGSQYGLWKSDGTVVGTTFVAKCGEPGGRYYGNNTGFACNANTLFFFATTASAGTELWKTDGTLAGTVMIKDIIPGSGSSNPYNLTMVGDILYFAINNNTSTNGISQDGLWKSDGTLAGTINLSKGYCEDPSFLTNYRSSLIFAGYNDNIGTELWKINEPSALGIDQAANDISLNIYPNPSNGKFTFIFSGMFPEIKVYNLLGQTIYTEKFKSKNNEINLIGQPKGIYLYKLKDDNGTIKTGKLIIE